LMLPRYMMFECGSFVLGRDLFATHSIIDDANSRPESCTCGSVWLKCCLRGNEHDVPIHSNHGKGFVIQALALGGRERDAQKGKPILATALHGFVE
jgi:hypothetical protein